MNVEMSMFMQDVRSRMLRHLDEDILPYWLLPTMLGDPIGNFPTYADQNGVPDETKPQYVRMHGRQTYAYLAAYSVLRRKELLEYGLAGLGRLAKYENPNGGYYSQVESDGEVLQAPITIQDQCYSVFPYIMAYRVTGESRCLDKIWRFIEFIDRGPYLRDDGTYVDSLYPDLQTEASFETETTNIVSVIDFLNLILIPALRVSPSEVITDERRMLLVKWMDMLVRDFWSDGIFWNERRNRTNWQAKHVDLGHTSKSYGILFKVNELMSSWGMLPRHVEIISRYPEIAMAASDDKVGWLTDFDVSATTFREGDLSWWRHILIDQTVFRYAQRWPELLEPLRKGIAAWFSCDFVDHARPCRGIREGLGPGGRILSDENAIACKANCWKSAYHEVEHVLTLMGEE